MDPWSSMPLWHFPREVSTLVLLEVVAEGKLRLVFAQAARHDRKTPSLIAAP